MRRAQYSNLDPGGAVIPPGRNPLSTQRLRVVLSCLAVLALVPAAARAASGPGAVLREYLAARWRGDTAKAEALWDAEDRRRSQALGTTYPGLEARYDDRLLWSAEERATRAATRPVFRDSTLEGGWARYAIVLPAITGTDTLDYWLRQSSGEWHVTSPYAKVARGWTEREGRYFRLHASKLRSVNAQALQALDDGIQHMLDRLATPEQARLRLERIKIEYFLCDTNAELRSLGARPGASGYRLAGERVVSRQPVDLNAASRVVSHLAFKDTPPYAVAVLEEGLAATLGGWGGTARGVLQQRGANLAAEKSADLAAVLDPAAMRRMAPETAVALSTVWADGLLRTLGPQKYAALARSLSGTETQLATIDGARVRSDIETATGKRGPALEAWAQSAAAGVTPPLAGGCKKVPVESSTKQALLRWRDAKEQWALEGFAEGEEYVLVLGPYAGPIPAWAQHMIDSLATARGEKPKPQPPRPRPAGDPPQLTVLIRERIAADGDAYESPLFQQQFAKRNYAGELFGLFISPDGASMYDYRRDVLCGETSKNARPGEPAYYDEKSGRLCFRMRRDLLPKPLDEYIAMVVVYTGE